MTGQQDSKPPGAGFAGGRDGAPAEGDVVELGGDRRPLPSWWPPKIPRFTAILAAAALVAGLGAGYAVGVRHGGTGAGTARVARPAGASGSAGASAAPASVGGPTLAQSGHQCSAQHGTTLQLGVQVSNESATALTLGQAGVVLPLGGLRVTAVTWGACGELPVSSEDPPQSDATDRYLPPGARGWLTVTVSVLVTCPGPLPVQFVVSYQQQGKLSTVHLPGFADLSTVGYPGCPAS